MWTITHYDEVLKERVQTFSQVPCEWPTQELAQQYLDVFFKKGDLLARFPNFKNLKVMQKGTF